MKVKKILFAVLLICCSFLMVNAKENEVFKYDWTKEYKYADSWRLYHHNKVYYDEGYITTDIDFDYDETGSLEKITTMIVQYDLKGEVVKEKEISDFGILYLEVHDNDIYAIGAEPKVSDMFFVKMNFDFEVEKKYLDEYNVIDFDYYRGYYTYGKDLYPYFFAVKDDEVFVLCRSGVLTLNNDFKNVAFKLFEDFVEEELSKMYELFSFSYERKEEILDECYSVPYFAIRDDIEAYIYVKNEKIYLRVYKDDKELYTKKLSSNLIYNHYIQISSFEIVSDYILIMSQEEILVYDLNGVKVQTIYIDDALEVADIKENVGYNYRFYNLVPGNNSFMYSICEIDKSDNNNYRLCLSHGHGIMDLSLGMTGSQIDMKTVSGTYSAKIYDQVWYLPINVITKTDGNGQVEAIDTARYGDVVTFKVTPNKGYILESVKVTDSNGNVVVFTDYTFTVPSSDVTIEATFVPENPDTSVGLITLIILFIIAILALGIRIRSKHKVKDMI